MLLEPHFTAPRAVATNAAAAIAIYFTATREGIHVIWDVYLGLGVGVLLAAFIVLTEERFRDRPFLAWVTTKFGRARVFGIGALFIESLPLATSSTGDGVVIFLGATRLLAFIALDWTKFLLPRHKRTRLAVLEAAVDPNLLLFSSPGQAGIRVSA